MLLEQSISSLVENSKLDVTVKGTELLLYKHPLAERLYTNCDATLHKYAVISEGEHNMAVDPQRASATPDSDRIPAIQDSELALRLPQKGDAA